MQGTSTMSMKRLLFAAAALAVSMPAAAAIYEARLAAPAPQPKFISSDRMWRCNGEACRAGGGATSAAAHICSRLAGRVGRLTGFSVDGRAFGAGGLDRCNADALSGGVPREPQ